mmetsp:Transcript_6055/g.22900  ORF Transcript_6055/g.22900 Transcript_6055/m.22900 type:complete len:310 (-) Transcript_6055:370-1299(-)
MSRGKMAMAMIGVGTSGANSGIFCEQRWEIVFASISNHNTSLSMPSKNHNLETQPLLQTEQIEPTSTIRPIHHTVSKRKHTFDAAVSSLLFHSGLALSAVITKGEQDDKFVFHVFLVDSKSLARMDYNFENGMHCVKLRPHFEKFHSSEYQLWKKLHFPNNEIGLCIEIQPNGSSTIFCLSSNLMDGDCVRFHIVKHPVRAVNLTGRGTKRRGEDPVEIHDIDPTTKGRGVVYYTTREGKIVKSTQFALHSPVSIKRPTMPKGRWCYFHAFVFDTNATCYMSAVGNVFTKHTGEMNGKTNVNWGISEIN